MHIIASLTPSLQLPNLASTVIFGASIGIVVGLCIAYSGWQDKQRAAAQQKDEEDESTQR